MKKKEVKKLNLGKKTITKLTENEAQSVNGGSFGSIIQYSIGCATDFTRPRTIVIGTIFHP